MQQYEIQRRIGVERGDEFRDIAVPGILRRVLPAILDEKMLHARSSPCVALPWNRSRCRPAFATTLGLASIIPCCQ